MTKELTHGKPLPLILQFAFPLILGYMLQQLYSLCDTVIVGRCLGVNELAAVGSTGAVSFLVVGFATGMCTGMSIPVAQAFGAGDYQKLRKYLANSFYLSALISIVMTVGTIIFTGDLLRLMKTPEELYDLRMIISLPCLLVSVPQFCTTCFLPCCVPLEIAEHR